MKALVFIVNILFFYAVLHIFSDSSMTFQDKSVTTLTLALPFSMIYFGSWYVGKLTKR